MKDRPINNGSIKSANRLTVIRLIDELGTWHCGKDWYEQIFGIYYC